MTIDSIIDRVVNWQAGRTGLTPEMLTVERSGTGRIPCLAVHPGVPDVIRRRLNGRERRAPPGGIDRTTAGFTAKAARFSPTR